MYEIFYLSNISLDSNSSIYIYVCGTLTPNTITISYLFSHYEML